MTNTSETQGNKALRVLGLHADESDAFERVYGGVFTAPACKPQREAFEKVLADAGVDASRCGLAGRGPDRRAHTMSWIGSRRGAACPRVSST